ncbi:MAG: toprim domain-containing protein [Candidatus Woesearchaeota archaeon]|jgi:hypothetical protein|nr:toprim domain-containing protein [Candidatus Woesearchaeota archaeon]
MYKLNIGLKITKELLLSKHSQETYMEHYLGVPVKKGLFCSPPFIRIDKQPTCAFYKNKRGVLKFKDFAGPNFDFVGAVQYINNCSYYKALKIIANDFGFIEISSMPKNLPKIKYSNKVLKITEKAKIQVEIKDFSVKELEWWWSFGISKNTLKKFKVFSIKSVFLNGHYHTSSSDQTPIYGYYGGLNSDDNELWRLYMPTKRKFRFLSNWSATTIQGARQLPKFGDILVITKSMKDVMSLYEHGIIAVAPNSENLFLTQAQYKRVKNIFNDVYLLYDRDLAGIRGAKKIRENFPDIKILLVPKTKDFSDFVKKYGSLKTLNIIEEWKNRRKNQKENAQEHTVKTKEMLMKD